MEFSKELGYEEIKGLSIERRESYTKWLEIKKRQEKEKETQNWTLRDWDAYQFTLVNFFASRIDSSSDEEEISRKVNERIRVLKKEEFNFFRESTSPFSQWYPSVFTAPVYMFEGEYKKNLIKNGYSETIEFLSAEQYMMYCKAMLFTDRNIAKRIIETKEAKEVKDLGRGVKNFVEDTWEVFRWQIVYQGNYYKFTQNTKLQEVLLSTQGTTLVEASPFDKIWGIGLSKDNKMAQIRQTWQGKNLLGEILTELRIELMKGKY